MPSLPTPGLRKRVAVAFLVTVAGIAAGEALQSLLFPRQRILASRVITAAFAGLLGAVAAWWTYRRQAQLHVRVAEQEDARTRLEELQAELLRRTVDLEDANLQLESEVTERRRMEQALRESQERYALAARGANDGLWDWNLDAGEIYLSERWREMVGAVGRELSASPDEWFGRVHLGDLPQLKVDIAAQAAGVRSHFLSEHRLRHAEGFFIWVLCRGIVVRDADGRALRIAGSVTDITARKDLEDRLRREAQFDALTGLPNRSYATDLLRRTIARGQRNTELQFAVLFLDCDRFKVVNDSLGHHAGDALLRLVAGRLNACVRPGDVVARLGGDEFVIILEGIGGEDEAVSVAERVEHALTQPFYLGGRELFMSVSVGIAMNQEGVQHPEDYVRDADLAMYSAKSGGRAKHAVFRSEMRSGAVRQMLLETDLRHALERAELDVVYQPIWSLVSGRITGFEALVRWNHPEHGALQPADFLSIAEETGLIIPLGDWVMRKAAERLARWNTDVVADSPIWMSVNVATRQLAHASLVGTVQRIMAETGIEPAHFRLEITESTIMADAAAAVGALAQLTALGVHLLMDDFGTGHASLSYLHRLPISTIKIDRYFVGRLDSDDECLEIVRTILDLSRSLGMNVIAEGVENGAQRDGLHALGCEFAQGYLLSAPVDAEAAERLLVANRALESAARR